MKNLKLKLIRQKIDKLDDKLLNLIKIRTNLVTGVLKQKRYKNQIIDKARIKEVLTLIKKKSISRKIDPKITKKIWRNIIRAYIDFEKRNFKKK
ncbi:MAG TPA: chorismate mutase [Pelagibacteraceae bacterium]|jgi:chorismate mutase|nr:chorismate mutase [Pelagibacteraceae bacterium]|tara:strand:+ start:102 stop:383 length:282 start_codon:yes stop_codon:yes gene_type:complete